MPLIEHVPELRGRRHRRRRDHLTRSGTAWPWCARASPGSTSIHRQDHAPRSRASARCTRAARPGPLLDLDGRRLVPPADFARFVERRPPARRPNATVLAVTPLVHDEKPLWVDVDHDGRVSDVGGPPGDAVTAGIYVFPEAVRRRRRRPRSAGCATSSRGSSSRASRSTRATIEKVVDVDRAEDVALAESLAHAGRRRDASGAARVLSGASSGSSPTPRAARRDDAEILRSTGQELAALGFRSRSRAPTSCPRPPRRQPSAVLPHVRAGSSRSSSSRVLEAPRRPARERPAGHPEHLPGAHDRALFAEAAVPFIGASSCRPATPTATARRSRVAEARRRPRHAGGRRRLRRDAAAVLEALGGCAARGIARAVVQAHVEGDLMKFYGIGAARRPTARRRGSSGSITGTSALRPSPSTPTRWPQPPPRRDALGLDVYGGDAIVTAGRHHPAST